MGACKGSPLRRCGCVEGGSCAHSLFQLERQWERGTGCQHDPHTFDWFCSFVLHANVQIPSCGSIVLCYRSHPAPGAFGMELLSAAPQNHPVHPTQHLYRHAEHSLEWTRGCNIQSAFQWLSSSERQQGCVYWGAYFTHQKLLQIFKPFLPEDCGKDMACKEPVVEKDYLHCSFSRKRCHCYSWHRSQDYKCLCLVLTGLGKHPSPSPPVRTAQPRPCCQAWQGERGAK